MLLRKRFVVVTALQTDGPSPGKDSNFRHSPTINTERGYEGKSVGLGIRFLDEVEHAVSMLTENPGLGAVWRDPALTGEVEIRRFPLRVFPFLIVYAIEPELMIVAIAHGSRRPGFWATRAP